MDRETYIALIAHNFPQIAIQTVQPITRGWDSFVLVINNELIFRFPMRDDVMGYLQYDPFSKLLYGSYGNEQIFAQGIEKLQVLSVA
jgi:hypothetical protein